MREIATRIALAAAIAGAAATDASAWWDRCNCEDARYGAYRPAPVYGYDHNRGPVWTSNGWSYPPVSSFYPDPPSPVAPALGCSPLDRIPFVGLFRGHADAGC